MTWFKELQWMPDFYSSNINKSYYLHLSYKMFYKIKHLPVNNTTTGKQNQHHIAQKWEYLRGFPQTKYESGTGIEYKQYCTKIGTMIIWFWKTVT